MNRNMVIVLAGGFLIAVLVAVLVQASLGGKPQPVATNEAPLKIVVAAHDMPTGTTLTDDDLKLQDWPKASVFPGAVVQTGNKKPLDLVSGTLRRPLAAGEPVIESALVKGANGNFVAASLGKGMRAAAVDVNATRMAGGFVGPGDYVDVILTYSKNIRLGTTDDPRLDEMQKLNIDRYATETILQNVKVLAVDQTARRESDKDTKDDGKVGKTVTLEVSPRGAETLALANEMGTVTLSLRKLGDDTAIDKTADGVVTDERLTHITREVYSQAHEITGKNNNTVRIYNGYTVEQPTVNP